MIAALLLSVVMFTGVEFDDLVGPVVRVEERGTAFAISPDQLLTCAHLIGDRDEYLTIDLDGFSERAKILKVDRARDLALLELPGHGRRPVRLAKDLPESLDEVWIVGCPSLVDPVPLRGYLSRKELWIERQCYLEIVAPGYPGTSGSPVFDAAGRLIGVQAMGMTNGWEHLQFLAYAVPLQTIRSFIDEGVQGHEWTPREEAPERGIGDGDESEEEGVEAAEEGVGVYAPSEAYGC